MKHRHTPFRRVLDQMTHDLAEAVLDAVRLAARAALQGEAPSFAAAPPFIAPPFVSAGARSAPAGVVVGEQLALLPEATPTVRPARQTSAVPSKKASRPKSRGVTTTADAFDDTITDEPNDAMIIDPMSMLAALESAAVREPVPAPRVLLSPTSLLRDAHADDAVPSERPIARSSAAFAPRTGEEVIRTGNGGLVLRRRRNGASPTVS